jgi:hypothetical protein
MVVKLLLSINYLFLPIKANKIQSLQAKIVKHQEQRDSGRFSVTFGSSRLFGVMSERLRRASFALREKTFWFTA